MKNTKTGGGEVALWRSVITLAIHDATGEVRPKAATSRVRARTHMQTALRTRHEARAWLLGNTIDFRRVCEMAGLDPDAVFDSAEKMMQAGWPDQTGDGVIVWEDDDDIILPNA